MVYNQTMGNVETQLTEAGSRRHAARAALKANSAEIASLARKAHKDGVPKTRIAALAQISRPALDKLLDGTA